MSAFYPNSNMVTAEDEAAAAEEPAAHTLLVGDRPAAEKPAAPELPEAVKQLREAPERKMFDAVKQYTNVFARGTFQDALAGEDPEIVQQIDEAVAGIYSDMQLSNPEAQSVHDVFTMEVTDELAASWRSESEAYIKSLGPDAHSRLEDARALVRRDPQVFELLKGPHGDNPTIVKLVIEKSRAEKLSGRLK